jgi:hypothetical protein
MLLQKDGYHSGSEVKNMGDRQNELPSLVENNHSQIIESGFETLPTNSFTNIDQFNHEESNGRTCSIQRDTKAIQMVDCDTHIPSMPCVVASTPLQQHSDPGIHCEFLNSTPTQTTPDRQHTATQTTTPPICNQSMGTIPPADVALQTTLPHTEMKELQTEKVSLVEVCTQYTNPCVHSTESMTVPIE